MLDVKRLRVLRSVVTSGSINAAATNLGYTPSAISQHIAALQRETGTALLERVGRGVRPTAAGQLLADHAELVLASVAEAEAALADLLGGRTGRLSLRYFATAGAALVPPVIARLRTQFPDLRLDLTLSELAYDADSAADVEIVVFRPEQPLPERAEALHLLDDPYVVMLPLGHPLAEHEILDLAQLAGEAWVDNEWPDSMCRKLVLDACAAAGFTPRFAVEAHDYATAMALVVSGLGVTVVPRLALTTAPAGVLMRPLRHPEPVRSIYALVRPASAQNPAVIELLRGLRAAAAER